MEVRMEKRTEEYLLSVPEGNEEEPQASDEDGSDND